MRCLEDSLCRYVGQTVTVFTVSGGLSGSGFTGVLAHVGNGCIRLITSIGAAPACAVGSECCGWDRGGRGSGWGGWGGNWGCGKSPRRERCGCGRRECRCREREEIIDVPCESGRNWLGSVTEIPVDKIASFTHHAI